MKYVPDLRVNLFSITSAMKNGAFIQSNGRMLSVKKNETITIFDQIIRMGDGFLMGVKVMVNSERCLVAKEGKQMNVNKFH